MCQNLPWNISKSRPHTSSIFMSFSIKSRKWRWNSKMKWKPEPEVVFCAILVKTKFLGFLGLVSRWYVYVRRRRDRQIDLSTSDALDRRRGLEIELLCPGEPTPITLSVHESVLSQKLVFWTSNSKHVIKHDIYVKFPWIFAHNVQICAKFCCKNFNDVCQVFWILYHYTWGGISCEHAVVSCSVWYRLVMLICKKCALILFWLLCYMH